MPEAPRERRPPRVIVGVVVAVLAVIAVAVGVLIARDVGRPTPSFESLTEHPDRSLHGTVAYFATTSRCVRIVAAAGGPSKDVLCLPPMDVSTAEKLGKEQGPQLVWLPDGRLEVTMFRMPVTPGPGYRAGWQKIVDVRTGRVEDVPGADAPSDPNLDTRPTVSPDGARITTESHPESGSIKVSLTDEDGTRTLLSAHGPGSYTYGLRSAFWAPDWRWIAADDGRILIITVDDPSVTRVLTDETHGSAFGDDPRQSPFAVTDEDLLTSGG